MKSDTINHPVHYTSGGAACSACGHPIECIDVTRKLGFNAGNIIKYVWRSPYKSSELEDLKKAQWYLNDLISTLTPKEK